MGWLELFRKPRDRWAELDQALTAAFWKVRNDIGSISGWIRYFRDSELRNQQLHTDNAARLDISSRQLEAQRQEIEALKAQLYDFGIKLESAMAQISSISSPFPDQVRTKSGPKSEPGYRQGTKFERVVIAKARPIKKEYVMNHIVELAAKGNYTTKQIETIIVREKMICGRTAFYDYLRELKVQDMLRVSERGVRRVLLSNKRGQ